MNEDLAPAYLVHSVPGRIRVRIPAKRGDSGYFKALAESLSGQRLGAVSVNASTGSVVVRAAGALEPSALAASARALSLFDLQAAAPRGGCSPLVTATAGMRGIDGLFLRVSGGYLDFRSSVFIALLILAGRQIYKGQFMVPGFTFLWYALTLMMME